MSHSSTDPVTPTSPQKQDPAPDPTKDGGIVVHGDRTKPYGSVTDVGNHQRCMVGTGGGRAKAEKGSGVACSGTDAVDQAPAGDQEGEEGAEAEKIRDDSGKARHPETVDGDQVRPRVRVGTVDAVSAFSSPSCCCCTARRSL